MDKANQNVLEPVGQRKRFSNEFKQQAVARLKECDNATALALEHGVRRNQLYKWAKQLEEAGPGKVLRAPGRPASGHGRGASRHWFPESANPVGGSIRHTNSASPDHAALSPAGGTAGGIAGLLSLRAKSRKGLHEARVGISRLHLAQRGHMVRVRHFDQ